MLAITFTGVVNAQNMVYPGIEGYGGVIEIPFETEKPDLTKVYKLVVELGKGNPDLKSLDNSLDYIARMYNLHLYAGIPKENLEVAIVLYAGAGPIALSNQVYSKRHGSDNPNADLLDKMLANGIKVVVCGQTMMKQEMVPADLHPGLIPAVSRFTALTDLMQKGYQLVVL